MNKILSTSALLTLIMPTLASAITLESITDLWIRESAANTTYDGGDAISVWNSFGNDTGTRRYGVVEFDLSSLDGLDVTSVGLRFWDQNNSFSDDLKPIKQSAVWIDTTGGTQASAMTWNVYQNQYASSATPFDTLGDLDFAGTPSTQGYLNSAGTDLDESIIEQLALSSGGGNQRLTLILIADELDGVEYAHSWGDGSQYGMKPQLIINDPLPEPVELTLEVKSDGSMSIVNPGVDPQVNTMFEIDGYVIGSPNGSLNVGGFTGLVGAGQAGWEIVAPTANALTELNLTSSTVFSEGDSLPLGVGFNPASMRDLTFAYSLAGGGTKPGHVTYAGYSADFDDDGDVDIDDLTDPVLGWQARYGIDLDGHDFLAWQRQFGSGVPLSAASKAIPEPSTMLILCVCCSGLAIVRPRS